MEELNSLIEEAIVKYDNFGEKKPTKQSTIKAYRDIICKLKTNIQIKKNYIKFLKTIILF